MTNPIKKADVIVLAGGSGLRMNRGINKVFLELLGIPILIRTLLKLDCCSHVNWIVPVIRKEDELEFQNLIKKYPLSKLTDLVIGGVERSDSVRNGLEFLQSNKKGAYVLTHDGARPFFSHNLIANLLNEIEENNCVIPTTPVAETTRIKRADGKSEVIDRNLLALTQTPQAFSINSVEECFLSNSQRKLNLTDEASYFESLGYEVKQIPGEKWNVKITSPEDLDWAECLLNQFEELNIKH